jgi:hypothetical protein
MTYLELRTLLETTLGNRLGTYTILGAKTPAIVGLDSGESLEDGRKVAGLECVISRTPAHYPKAVYGATQFVKNWQVFLVQWAGSPRVLNEELVEEILALFPNSTAVPLGLDQQREIIAKVSMRLNDRTDLK